MAKWQATLRRAIRSGSRPSVEPRCSFCGKRRRDVQKVIAGPGVFICDQCVRLCNEVLVEDRTTLTSSDAQDSVLLDQLRLAGQQFHIVEAHVRGAVAELRKRGTSWAQIGEALGISRQSAWERFSGED
jgi:hypothetical protein